MAKFLNSNEQKTKFPERLGPQLQGAFGGRRDDEIQYKKK